MSVPASKLPAADRLPHERPAPAFAPPSPSRRRGRQSPAVRQRPRAQRGLHARFAFLAGAIVACLLVGVVSLQAMLAQTSFHSAELQSRIAGLSDRYESLASEAARLSSPARIRAWATADGMRIPDAEHTVILRVPARAGGREAVESDLAREAGLVKAIVGASAG